MSKNKKEEPHKKHRVLRTILLVFGILLLLIGAELLYSNYHLIVSRYSVRAQGVSGGIRIVFLADLHGREFGKNNSSLLEKIAAEKPDIIALGGDIINSDADDEEVTRMCAFVSEAAKIAPVYFGMGNHEYNYIADHDASLAEKLTEAGAEILDGNYLDIEINGTPVRIGGYEGYYRTAHMNTPDKDRQSADWRFFEAFEDTDRVKILINHIPTNWLDWHYKDRSPVDLVLSGHYHGGVIRIPIIEQGLYAPYIGKFPPYTKGLFEGEKANCVLTTGLAGSKGIPRFFNPPEIVVVDLLPEE